jgi:hypothetical protein
MLLANGCDLSVLVRCTPHAEATVTRWLERMGAHSQRLRVRFFQQVVFRVLQLDELHARVRREGVQWLWGARDPVTKVIPTLHLEPRTTEAAMHFMHLLVQVLAPGCVPAFTTDGLQAYFYALTAHFGQWGREPGQRKAHWQVADELLHGQLVKRKGRTVFAVMPDGVGQKESVVSGAQGRGLQRAEPDRVCGAGESDDAAGDCPVNEEDVGVCPDGGPSCLACGVVAGLLSFRPSTRKPAMGSTRLGPQAETESSDGGGDDGQAVDGRRHPAPATLACVGLKKSLVRSSRQVGWG